MNRLSITLFTAMFLSSAISVSAAQAARPLTGSVIMARAGTNPLYVWNATPYIAQLGTDKQLGEPGLRNLEATAVTALAEKASTLSSQTVSMRAVYEKTGAVSPLYRTSTFEGLEDVMTITVDRKALLASTAAWVTALEAGTTPHGVKIDITGALPPPY
jgi:hypothetical protein